MERLPNAGVMLLLLAILTPGCKDTPEERAKAKGEELWFEELVHDFGEIRQEGDGTWSFVFKNLGEDPIVINRVRSTCGCTVPSWPGEPVEPGAGGEIEVRYNTSQTGTFLKSVYVYSTAANTPVKLQVKGKVVPAG